MGKCNLSGITCRVERVDCQHCAIVALYPAKAVQMIEMQLNQVKDAPKEMRKVGKH
jgi:hypothetical protein